MRGLRLIKYSIMKYVSKNWHIIASIALVVGFIYALSIKQQSLLQEQINQQKQIQKLEFKIDSIQKEKDILINSIANQNSFINNLVAELPKVKETGVLPSIFIAQAILESGMGKSKLTKKSNNIFCIKGSYKGKSIQAKDDEPGLSSFRKYSSYSESIDDYLKLMQTKRYCDLLGNKDYKYWASMLKKKGYASSPVYTKRLIDIIEKYKLTVFDIV